MSQQFFDNFALANLSLQERLGKSATTLNRDSAVFGQQTRSLLQMLNYGLDAVTARAASHLLNMDVLYSNDAYLLKLSEGILLNSIESITPPKINASTPFRFWSERSYTRWSSLGTISLKDGSKTNLIIYNIDTVGRVEASELGVEYKALYCAGDFVQQTITTGFDGYTPGIFAPIYIPETYKSVWSESVEVTLDMDNGDEPIGLVLAWSLDELLAMPDNSCAALIQHTPRGMTLTLGDGEIFGSGYNKKSNIKQVTVTYVKCDNLAPVEHSTIKFNRDVTEIVVNGMGVPLMSPMDAGDTPDSLRSRAIAEFFSAGKITNERDLVTEVNKIPFVKSCFARREYNWPIFKTASILLQGYNDYKSGADTNASKFYNRYCYNTSNVYSPGDIVVYDKALYICSMPQTMYVPSTRKGWVKFIDLTTGDSLNRVYSTYFASANVYDNATIVLSGLVMKNRRYWNSHGSYRTGDVVYHQDTKKLWLALRDGGNIIEPGSEDNVSIYDDARCWVTHDEAYMLEEDSAYDNDAYKSVSLKFDDYEPMTQAMFESEIKGYFNIAGKLGFTSVVVEPLDTVAVIVNIQYTSATSVQQDVRKTIEDYVCYQVGKTLEADILNAMLTEQYNLSSVYVSINLVSNSSMTGISVTLPTATYVPPSKLEVSLSETLGRKR